MTWFGKILSQLNEGYGNQERTPDNIKFVPRYETAFKPGDTVFYLRNTGKERAYFYGTVQKVEAGKVYYIEKDDESGKVRFRDYNNGDLYHCLSWLKPIRESGAWQFLSSDGLQANPFKVGYETSDNLMLSDKHRPKEGDDLHAVEDGRLFIFIHWTKRGFKEYYDYGTGEFVGSVNVGAMNVSKSVWMCEKGKPEPKKVNKNNYDPNQYVMVPEKYQDSAVIRVGATDVWNFKLVFVLLHCFPWLKGLKAKWTEPGSGKIAMVAVGELPNVKARLKELGI